MTVGVTIPNDWVPRVYQLPLWKYLAAGGRNAVAVWHRRAGKDSLALNWTAFAAHRRVGVYWHMLPTQKQGRKVIWDGIDKQGRRMIDQVFPEAIRKSTNSQEMRIELKNGSIWQVVGSDNFDSLVGANPVGVIMSEYSVANPVAWRFLSPILKENGGWSLFIYTPRGKNHGFKLFKMAKKNARWFCELLTLKQSGAYPLSIVEEEREEGMTEEMVQQEYYCSFDAAIEGSYYGKYINTLKESGRLTRVPWEPKLPVHTGWDIGVDDDTDIWFAQQHRSELRIIDHYANRGFGFEHYSKKLQEKPYTYGEHYLPHDIEVRNMDREEIPRTRRDILEDLLKQRVTAIKKYPGCIEDGIQAVRALMPRMYVDESLEDDLEDLALYSSVYDEKKRIYVPAHNWTSHKADSMRSLCVGLKEDRPTTKRQTVADANYDPTTFGMGQSNRQTVAVEDYDPFS